MYTIVKEGSGEVPALSIEHYYPSGHGYEPKVAFAVCYNEQGFHAHFDVFEAKPLATKTKHFELVNEDSCVEWFVKFAPELSDNYFNFEVNSIGTMNVSFRKNRHENKINLTEEDVKSLNIQAQVFEDFWTVDYTVPFELIKKYIPGYEFKTGTYILANAYKCGDLTEFPHFGCWNMTDPEKCDFHRPEYFEKMNII